MISSTSCVAIQHGRFMLYDTREWMLPAKLIVPSRNPDLANTVHWSPFVRLVVGDMDSYSVC
jgi:hypothetical protein